MIIFIINFILTQIELGGLTDAAKESPVAALLVTIVLVLSFVVVKLYSKKESIHKTYLEKINELNKTHLKKIEEINKENVEKLEKIRKEIFEKEEIKNKQWIDSEKETLNVIKGLTGVLELSEKLGRNDTSSINNNIENLNDKIDILIGLINK